jgi:hypothetical protein
VTSYTCGGNINVQKESDKVCDLRGFKVGIDGPSLPPHYCRYCQCPPIKCHQRILGKFIQLQVVCEILENDDEPSEKDIEDMVRRKYRSGLRQKIFDETKTLDRYSYPVPSCIEQKTLGNLYQYSEVTSYHNEMIQSITNGRGRPIKRKRNFGVRSSPRK